MLTRDGHDPCDNVYIIFFVHAYLLVKCEKMNRNKVEKMCGLLQNMETKRKKSSLLGIERNL